MAHTLTRNIHNKLYDGSKGKAPFQLLAPPSLTLVTLTSSTNTLLFLSSSNGMVADIASLAAGLDGHGVGVGIERKGSRKKGIPILCPSPSATITDTFTQLGRLCPLYCLVFYSSIVIPLTHRRH
jgi:hypothetical protein